MTRNGSTNVVSELADYLKRKNPKRRGYSKRNLYNMVRFYDVYSSPDFAILTEQLRLSEFVQMSTAQIAASQIVQLPTAQIGSTEIVQMASAQFATTPLPAVLCLTTFSNHSEIANRCSSDEERIFYILYSAHNHLKYEELRRCIVNQTYESVMSKEKMMSPTMVAEYKRILVPREVMKKSLAEYCEFLKDQYK